MIWGKRGCSSKDDGWHWQRWLMRLKVPWIGKLEFSFKEKGDLLTAPDMEKSYRFVNKTNWYAFTNLWHITPALSLQFYKISLFFTRPLVKRAEVTRWYFIFSISIIYCHLTRVGSLLNETKWHLVSFSLVLNVTKCHLVLVLPN